MFKDNYKGENTLTPEQILNILKGQEYQEYFKSLNINSVLIFGSVVNGDFYVGDSDIDLAFISDRKLDFFECMDIESKIECNLKIDVDIVNLKSETLDYFIKVDVLNTGQILYTSDNNVLLEHYREIIEWIFKENETFFYFRRRDLLEL